MYLFQSDGTNNSTKAKKESQTFCGGIMKDKRNDSELKCLKVKKFFSITLVHFRHF